MTDNFVLGRNRITVIPLTRSFVRQGSGPIQTCLSLETTRRLNGAGEWRAAFPDNDPATQRLTLKATAVDILVDGRPHLRGIVERRSLALNERGERTLTVSGRDMLGELAETALTTFEIGTPTPTTNLVPGLFVAVTSRDPAVVWTGRDLAGVANPQTTRPVVASVAGESALAVLTMVAEHIGESFRTYRDGTRQLTWLGAQTPSSGVRAVGYAGEPTAGLDNPHLCYIQAFEVEQDGFELLTRITPYGSGQGAARMDIFNHTATEPTGYSTVLRQIVHLGREAALGKQISKVVEFKDIRPLSGTDTAAEIANAKRQLYYAGLEYLKRAIDTAAVTTYRLSVSHVPDALDVGTTVRVIYQDDVYRIDANLVVLEIRSRYGAGGGEAHELIVSPIVRKPVSDDHLIADELEQARIFSAHPQWNVNGDTYSYRAYVGGDQTQGKAEMRFWFGREVMQLEKVLLRFTVTPLVSTASAIAVESITSGPSSTTTTGSGGDTTETSDPDNAFHGHEFNLANGSTGSPVYYNSGIGALMTSGGGTVGVNATNATHAHDVDIPPHTHGMAHTHTITPTITTEFGIYRAAQIDTYAIGDLEYRLNGGAWTALSTATVKGGGWYELDLTAGLYDANFRPINEANILEVRRTTAAGGDKTAMIDAYLYVRTVIMGNALV